MNTNQDDLISVVIPAYNHEKYVQDTIKSIINQTFSNLELIIIDDGSQDSTFEKINCLSNICTKRFINFILRTQKNQSTVITLNRLIHLTKGKYIYLIASDDIAKPEAISTLYTFLSQNENYLMAVGDNEFIDSDGKICFVSEQIDSIFSKKGTMYKTFIEMMSHQRWDVNFHSDYFGNYESLTIGNYIPNGYLIKKGAFQKTDFFTKEAPLEDVWMHLQISKLGKIKYIDRILLSYRQHPLNTVKKRVEMCQMTLKTLNYEKQTCSNEHKKLWRKYVWKFKLKKILFLIKKIFSKLNQKKQTKISEQIQISDIEWDRHKKWCELSNNGQFYKAIELCLATTLNPVENFLASSFLGYAYFQLTQYELASLCLANALIKYPNDYHSTFFLARSLDALGRKCEALEIYMDCYKKNPSHRAEILNYAMPLAFKIKATYASKKFFINFESWIKNSEVSPIFVEKFLFFDYRDLELQEKKNAILISKQTLSEFRSILSIADFITKKGQGSIAWLGAAEITHIRTPHAKTKIQKTLVYSNTPYVATIHNASIVGESSLIFIDHDIVLSDLLAHKQYGHYANLRHDKCVVAQRRDALLINAIETTKYLDKGIMLSGFASGHYGHWFAEFLPKLFYFEQHPEFSHIPIIVDDNMPTSHYDFLRTLVTNSLYMLSSGVKLKVEQLLIAPTICFFPVELFPEHNVPPEHQGSWTVNTLNYIKQKIQTHFSKTKAPSNRIFLSRKKSTWRRLENEDEIVMDLQSLGFQIILLEEHNFADQVRIIQNAEFIIAPQGSAINNCIFADKNTKILILGTKNYFNWGGWFGPMSDLGYSPVFLSGKAIGDENNKHANYTVPVTKIRKKILKMIKN